VHQKVTPARWRDAQTAGLDHVEQLLISTQSDSIQQAQPCVLTLDIEHQQLAAHVTADDTDTMP
jgi:hypothetical protein